MDALAVIAVFDVGKTNKKLFLFDENYRVVFERAAQIPETTDDNGFACEDLPGLLLWMFSALEEVRQLKGFELRAINFSAYGASLVLVDDAGKPVTPLYNYLKPYPENLQSQLYQKYGGKAAFTIETSSPALGSLNSGLQLYRLRIEKPELFNQVRYAIHLPQYLSFLFTRKYYSELTSIGCHTALWDFSKCGYHRWVRNENLDGKLAPIVPAERTYPASAISNAYPIGVGLHDSSAALVPYLINFPEPFVLISTGTWCITLNPFNHSPLAERELASDCLCYLNYQGRPVKASRIFSGFWHEEETKRISRHFGCDLSSFKTMDFDPQVNHRLQLQYEQEKIFSDRNLSRFSDATAAYHQLIRDLVRQQVQSTSLTLSGPAVKRIFVDGGFSRNRIFMQLLADSFPGMQVFAATMHQASALGAALVIHEKWNPKPIRNSIIELELFPPITNSGYASA